MCGSGTSPNCENRGATAADACGPEAPPAGTGSSMCPSTHPYAYRPLDNYDYCCDVADGSAYGAARPQTCAGTPEKCAAPPCKDYAKPATGGTTGVTTGVTTGATTGATTGTTGLPCGVKEAGFCGVDDFEVRDGDTLPSIAIIRKTTVAILACLNPSTEAKTGTIIKVPTKNCGTVQPAGTGEVNAATSRRGGAHVQWEAVVGTVLAAVAVASVAPRLFV